MFMIKSSSYIKGCVKEGDFPPSIGAEFMFCGRSNVGKSSFINMLTARKNLARTSQTPGKTQTLNFYLINKSFHFVDVPGYGYAKVSLSIRKQFGEMIEEYLRKRESLKLVFLLVDFRRGPTADDKTMYDFLRYFDIPICVIATKKDKVPRSMHFKMRKTIMDTLAITEEHLIVTSSETGDGLTECLALIESNL